MMRVALPIHISAEYAGRLQVHSVPERSRAPMPRKSMTVTDADTTVWRRLHINHSLWNPLQNNLFTFIL